MKVRIRPADVARMLAAWLVSTAALAVAVALLPGLDVETWWSLALTAAVTGVVGVLVRPVLVTVAARTSWILVALLAVAGQAIVMQIALEIVPGISSTSFTETLAAAWIAAILGTVISWLTSAGTTESFTEALVRAGRRHGDIPDPATDGVVFVQLDGVSFPVLQWALQSGSMPTLRRWIDSRSHRLQEWTVQLPCTTPASQQGILHGTVAGVPAFRWYDRELDRVLVANRPADAAIIEQRASDGRGLLADGGMSVSNIFSGDAERTSMTMSNTGLSRGSVETRRAFAWFFVRPDGFARSLARSIAELGRERHQARRQRRRDVRPRVHRSWTFAALRAATNGLLRDLNTAIVADEMMKGTKTIYVDYVDYDEVAHHAGMSRLDALSALEALDDVLDLLRNVSERAPRHYHFVVVSDHGQSQGDPFATRTGTELSDLCRSLMGEKVSSLEANVETWGRVESIFDDLGTEERRTGRAAQRVGNRLRRRTGIDDRLPEEEPVTPEEPVVVLGSGNLGLLYVKGPTRLTLEELMDRWPALVDGLAQQSWIGFVAGMSAERGPVVLGPAGRRFLRTGVVEGADPLGPFPPHAATVLLTALERPEAPELYVNSAIDPDTGEVAAFEDLVGCHGGLGGWQDRGVMMAPVDLLPEPPEIVGADRLHACLVGMLERLGHRSGLGVAEDAAS